MRFIRLRSFARLLAASVFLLAGLSLCTRNVSATSNPVPYIDSISPISAAPGGADFTLTVNGTNFVNGATVYWSGTALVTSFVSAEQLTATVTAALIANSGTGWITVTNPGPLKSNRVFMPVGASSAHDNFANFTYSSGASPVGVVQEDFNADGNLDLITANYGDNTLSVYLGNGDGSFQNPTIVTLPASTGGPVGLAVGDFNNDGIPDLVVGYDSSFGISILLGNGNGTFQAAQSFPAGTLTYQMVAGDYDGDGNLDVAVVNSQVGVVQVLLGAGDGTLGAPTPFTINSDPFFIQEADLNGDGFVDLVFGNYDGNSVSVLLGVGDGTFQTQETYTVGVEAAGVAIGDFDGDGKLDLIFTDQSTTSMNWLRGNGDGTFQAAQAIPVGFETRVIATGDFNADGKLDLAVVKNGGGGGVGILLGNGDGTFQSPQSFPGASFTYGIIVGNYNTGGGLAVATTDFATNVLDVLLQTVSVSPSTINFGSQPLGTPTAAQTFTVTNSTSQTVGFFPITLTGANHTDFHETDDCDTLLSGESCMVQVTFTPGAVGSRTATLNVPDNAPGSPQTAVVTGTGTGTPVVGLSSSGLAFPDENIGVASPSQAVTVTNTGNTTLNITSILVGGTNAADFNATNDCGATLAASAQCTVTTTFTPSAAGARSGTVNLTDDATDSPESISLSGTGLLAPTATLSVSSLTFASQVFGSASSAQAVTLTNNGDSALSITSIASAGSNATDFAVTTTCGSSLAAAGTCSISVKFTPGAAGSRSASITVTDSAASSPQSIALSGTGQDFSLTLGSPTATVTAGNTATLQLTVTPVSGFNQAITLTCTGAPAQSTCTVSPASVTPSGSPVDVTVSLVTTGASNVAPWRSTPRRPSLPATGLRMLVFLALLLLSVGNLGSLAGGHQLAPSRPRTWLLGTILLIGCLGLAACANTGPKPAVTPTAAGSYTLTITATSGSLSRSTTVQLTVQ